MRKIIVALLLIGAALGFAMRADAGMILFAPGSGGVPCGALELIHTVACNAITVQVFGS